MKSVSLDLKFDVGDKCYAFTSFGIVECMIEGVWVDYRREYNDYIHIQYKVIAKDPRGTEFGPISLGFVKGDNLFASKEEALKFIDRC